MDKCKCAMVPFPWRIERCPLHAAAPALLEALIDAESALFATGMYNLERWDGQAVRNAIDKARDVIRSVIGGTAIRAAKEDSNG